MPQMGVPLIIELVCATIMVVGTFGLLVNRIVLRRGFGARVIQFLAVVLMVPGIIILSLEKLLSAETTAALMGGLAGYLLSDIGRFDPSRKSDD